LCFARGGGRSLFVSAMGGGADFFPVRPKKVRRSADRGRGTEAGDRPRLIFSDFGRRTSDAGLFWAPPKKSPFLAPQKSQKSRGGQREEYELEVSRRWLSHRTSKVPQTGEKTKCRQPACRASAAASCRRALCTSGIWPWRFSWRPCRRSSPSTAIPR